MQLVGATLGDTMLPIGERGKGVRSGDRIVVDRGPVQERYDLMLEAVEQSFVVNAAGSAGDLDLQIAVQTELGWGEIEGGWNWSNDLGGVTYRGAVAIDGTGRRLDLPIQRTGNNLHLQVPAHWLGDAVDPIVVDPVLSTWTVNPWSTASEVNPDVSYDSTMGLFVFVMQHQFSTWIGTFWRRPGMRRVFLGTQWVDFTQSNWKDPAIAHDYTSHSFLVVAIVEVPAGNAVWCRSLSLDLLTMSPTVQVGDAVAGSHYNLLPDVGGKNQGSPMFKVVWQRHLTASNGESIRSATVIPTNPVSASVAPAVGPTELLATSFSERFTKPKISTSSGQVGNAEWRVAFCGHVNSSGQERIYVSRYADDNTLLHGYSPLYDIDPTYLLQSVDVSDGLAEVPGPVHGEPTYCVIANMSSGFGNSIWVHGLDEDSMFDKHSLTEREHQPLLGTQKFDGAIGTDRFGFICNYNEWVVGPNEYRQYETRFNLVSSGRFGVSERRLVLSNSPQRDGSQNCVVSTFSNGVPSFLSSASARAVYDGAIWRIRASATSRPNAEAAGYQYCVGFPNTTGDYAHLVVFGDASVAGNKTLHATAMPSNQFGYFLASQGGSGLSYINGGIFCLSGGPLGRYNQAGEIFNTQFAGTGDLTIGPNSYRGPGGNVTVAAGQTWNFQAWYRELGGFSNFTNAVSVTLE
ncbi:MAG: hypothetical protein R3F17_06015 [Planctomycetota bacterium]